jgi:uncharacterized phiE125 gp8 family phage protein
MGRKTMNYLIKTVQPTTEPVTLAETQLHLRLDTEGSPASHPDDSLVNIMISASRENAEQYTGVTIASATYEMVASINKDNINLQTFPVTSIASVTYVDSEGATQTVSSSTYSINNYYRPSRLYFTNEVGAYDLKITFTAGYTDGESPNPFPTPAGVKAAILLMVGNLYENRESVSNMQSYERPQSAVYLLTPHRINMGV